MKGFLYDIESFLEIGGLKKDILFIIISAIALIMSLFNVSIFSFNIIWVTIILCGIPIILGAIVGLLKDFDIKADVLVSIALIASIFIGEDFTAGEVAFIMQLGALLEKLTVAKARAGIEKLVNLTPQTARIILDEKEEIIHAAKVKINSILRVLPGEIIPVDGEIISGQTSINQSIMTGESIPVDKTIGDQVASGTVNQFGAFEMKATKVGEDSSIQRMIKLVESADANKAKIVGIADKWATWIVIIALTASILTWIFTGEIIRSVTILVVFCPCALVLATPTAIMAAIVNSTKHGFLVREGDALERLSDINTITFDKTGTLTVGKPKVIKVKSFTDKIDEEDLFFYAASAEKLSEHPLGKAVVNSYKEQYTRELISGEDFSLILGQGIITSIDRKKVIIGNKKLFKNNNITIQNDIINYAHQYLKDGCTVIYIAIEEKCIGIIVLSDTLREKSRKIISDLKENNIQSVLLTGDNEESTKSIAVKLNISKYKSSCLPEDKLNYIEEVQSNNEKVCMIGDGINDAPALKKATVGIAMGGVGSDIAIDAADIVLVDDKVDEIIHLIKLSKHMMKVIRYNLTFSMGLNFLAIILAIMGILNPVVGALVHNMGSIFVILNSSLLLKWK